MKDVTNSERPAAIKSGRRLRGLLRGERGTALIETAMTLPLLLLVSVGIFEFGRAYQTWQVLTNAAREGARVAVISGTTDADVRSAVNNYMSVGALGTVADSYIDVNRTAPLGSNTGSQITVRYPFSFMVLGPVVRLVNPSSSAGAPLTMSAVSVMRNE